jgi:hypothetical protein
MGRQVSLRMQNNKHNKITVFFIPALGFQIKGGKTKYKKKTVEFVFSKYFKTLT